MPVSIILLSFLNFLGAFLLITVIKRDQAKNITDIVPRPGVWGDVRRGGRTAGGPVFGCFFSSAGLRFLRAVGNTGIAALPPWPAMARKFLRRGRLECWPSTVPPPRAPRWPASFSGAGGRLPIRPRCGRVYDLFHSLIRGRGVQKNETGFFLWRLICSLTFRASISKLL